MRDKHGLDGWLEAYCVDRAVSFVGGVIDGALNKREERHTAKGTRWEAVYKSLDDVFAVINTGRPHQGSDAFISMSRNLRGVTVYG